MQEFYKDLSFISISIKLFADDTFLSSVTHDVKAPARELNDDLKKISNQTSQWKMIFNPDVNKEAKEVILDPRR